MSTPDMDVEASGIPNLRRDLLALPARGKLEKICSMQANRLPNVFNSIQSILTKPKFERKAELRKALVAALNPNPEMISGVITAVESTFKDCVGQSIVDNEKEWKIMAEIKLSQRAKVSIHKADLLSIANICKCHWSTFKSVCMRGGEWQRKNKEYINWNQDLQEIFKEELSHVFDKFDDSVEKCEIKCYDNTKDLIKQIQKILEGIFGQYPFFCLHLILNRFRGYAGSKSAPVFQLHGWHRTNAHRGRGE